MAVVLACGGAVAPQAGTGALIKSLKAFVVASREAEEEAGGGADYHSQTAGHWITCTPIANPMSVHPEYKPSRTSWGINALGSVVVEVHLEDGTVGVGISIGGEPACHIVEHHLARFVEGQDVRNVELVWDQMYRATLPYGRKGLPLHAISAVDLALWDALGKLRGEPVYNLLGGKTKERLPVYATTARPDLAQLMGFHGAKVPLPFGPADGDAGMKLNIKRLQAVRQSVGDDFPLMVDCYMSLTPTYAVELCRRIQDEVPGGVKWVEECLPPDDVQGYSLIKQRVSSGVLLTTGEHEYTRHGMKQLLDGRCCDVLQPDVTWVGGLTESRRIVALADAYGVPVVPHGSGVYSYHLQLAFTNCPIAEYLMTSPKADQIVPAFGSLLLGEPLPRDGYVELDPDKPGFGVELNRDGVELRRPYRSESTSSSGTKTTSTSSAGEGQQPPVQWLTDPVADQVSAANAFPVCDPHMHLWDAAAVPNPNLQHHHDHTPVVEAADYRADWAMCCAAADLSLVGCVHVETLMNCDPLGETRWLSQRNWGLPAGAVGWVCFADLANPDTAALDRQLAQQTQHSALRGVRMVLNHHPNDPTLTWPGVRSGEHLTDDPAFKAGFSLLRSYGLSFDLQVNPHQLEPAARFLSDFPDVPVVLNHMGLPRLGQGDRRDKETLTQWRDGMAALAELQQAHCKLSMFTFMLPDWADRGASASHQTLAALANETIDLFGPQRCMFASNHPVDAAMSTPLPTMFQHFRLWTKHRPAASQRQLFHDTAVKFYRLATRVAR